MFTKRKHCFTLVLLFISTLAYSQGETNRWYFGRFLGIDFSSGTAVPVNDGQLNTTEGVATICDAAGNLLFYTDGITVYNRLHQVMQNGNGLWGNVSSTQSAVIVPWIEDPSRYYIFTVDAQGGPGGLRYSVVNMALDNNNGGIELKNAPLQTNVVEKITAVRHCNNRDVWILTHGVMSDTYYAFLVTAAGVSTVPVVSHTGAVLPGPVPPSTNDSSALGYLKASPDGKKLVAANFTISADLSDFDNATGVISNTIDLFLPAERHYYAYGIEFSPNSKLIYTTVFYTDPVSAQKKNVLLQYDGSLATAAAIRASKQIIAMNSDPIQTFAALQVAPDGKMYMAKNTYKHIACINQPDVYGVGCGFVTNAIQYILPNQSSSFGLPTFVQSYFYPPDSFDYSVNCPGATFNFNYTLKAGTSSVQWDFGDPASGANNTSTQPAPSHLFSMPGSYTVRMVKFTSCGTDTLVRTIVADTINLILGADTVACGATTLLLNPTAAGSTNVFTWQDGSTGPTFTATTDGLYWVEARNNSGCIKRDSITVAFRPLPAFNLGPDTLTCDRDTLLLNAASVAANNYLWSTGAITSTIKAFLPGLYWCEVQKDGCSYRDSLTITGNKPSPVVDLGADRVVCEGTMVVLDASYPGASYLWQNGSTDAVFNVNSPGRYSVEVNLNGCSAVDTVTIGNTLKPHFTLGADQTICTGTTITLSPALNPSWQLLWQDGSSTPTHTLTQTGAYSLTASNACGSGTDVMFVTKGVCKVYVPTAFTPNNDGKNDVLKVLGTETVVDFHYRIYNRWGQIVFETRDKSKGWDGRLSGIPLAGDVFVYMLNYTDRDSQGPQFMKGTLVLIR